ncbi:MAG: TetR/AcrR family transcriptional regulator C-terminal domain-containing protein [Lachnospiraceae bacterium]|nr:TetR/AcrR family transcriptional regulator C-terminal domain-containing protein [Lachnospiraceae bacterium]
MTIQGKNGIDVILAESLKELSESRPIDKITIKEITDKAGVIRPTFYNHFQDKYELLEWIVREELVNPALPLIDNGLVKEGLTFIFTAMEKEKTFYTRAAKIEGQNSFAEMIYICAKEMILSHMNVEEVQAKGKYSWVTPDLVAEYYAKSLCVVVMRWVESGMKVPANEFVDVFMSLAQEPMFGLF